MRSKEEVNSMLEIPRILFEEFKKLLFDFDYFAYAILNGGWAAILGFIFVVMMISSILVKEK